MAEEVLEDLAIADVVDTYFGTGLAAWSDARLVRAVADVVAVPKDAAADSFVLHTPLELLARAELLRHLRPDARDAARIRLVWLAAAYNEAGPALRTTPVADDAFDGIVAAADHLIAAIGRSELDDVDRAAHWLGRHATAADLRVLLSAAVAPSLAAAAHAPILLSLLGRGDCPSTLLRGPARELGRQPEWRLHWFDNPAAKVAGPEALLDGLLGAPGIPVPGSTFIYPIMSQVQDGGMAAERLSGALHDRMTLADVADARRVIQRVAAWSMLQEADTYVPYGWTHCLTMPQAVLAIAGDGLDARTGIAIAATHVLGFRAVLGRTRLVAEPPPSDARTAERAWADLAANASRHHDAHLVKYTLAAMHAAAADPAYRVTYLAAARRLADYWAAQPDDGFPVAAREPQGVSGS